ncbi:MAG TPA: Ser-Thr-rich GPI-anchored membrane family protein [Acidobacteriota bacterium]
MIFRRLLFLLLLALLLLSGEQEIRIEFPNGGEVLKSGGDVRVSWRSAGVGGDLAILLFKGGEQYAVIAASAPDNGFFQWKISAALPDSGQYRLRICSRRDLRINDFSDRDFAIHK